MAGAEERVAPVIPPPIHLFRAGVVWGSRGGSSRYLQALGEGLAAADKQVLLSRGFERRGTRERMRFLSWAGTGRPCVRPSGEARGVIHAIESVVVPRACDLPLVVTAHDMCALRRPSLVSPPLALLKHLSWRRARSWDAVIVPSQATAGEVGESGVDPDRIHVIRHAIPQVFSTPPADDLVAQVKSLTEGRPFLLGVLPDDSRKKGSDVLREAWISLDRPDARLVWVGADRAQPGTIPLQGVADSLLAALYGAARALVAPSRCEGYSFPVAEALAGGTPVIASDIPAHREFDDEAIRLFPREDSAALRELMVGVLDNDRSKVEPRYFPTIDEMVSRHLAVYEAVSP